MGSTAVSERSSLSLAHSTQIRPTPHPTSPSAVLPTVPLLCKNIPQAVNYSLNGHQSPCGKDVSCRLFERTERCGTGSLYAWNCFLQTRFGRLSYRNERLIVDVTTATSRTSLLLYPTAQVATLPLSQGKKATNRAGWCSGNFLHLYSQIPGSNLERISSHGFSVVCLNIYRRIMRFLWNDNVLILSHF